MKTILTLLFIVSFQMTFAQTDYFEKGNNLLQQGKFDEAQKVFENGLKENPENLMYKNQIALSLINQGKNNEAEKSLKKS